MSSSLSSTPVKDHAQSACDESTVQSATLPSPSLFSVIQQQQVNKTGPLAVLMQEPYSSPGQVSRSRHVEQKLSPHARTRPGSAPAGHTRPRLNMKTIGRRAASVQLTGNDTSASLPNQIASFSPPANSSPFASVSKRRSPSGSPRGRASIPPRFLSLDKGSLTEPTRSDVFQPQLPLLNYSLVPSALNLPSGVLPSTQPRMALPVNLFRNGTLGGLYHTVAIPLDVFAQQLAMRPSVTVPGRMESPASPPTPTPSKLKVESCQTSPTPRQAGGASSDVPPSKPETTAARTPLATVSTSNAPDPTRSDIKMPGVRQADNQEWTVATRTKSKPKNYFQGSKARGEGAKQTQSQPQKRVVNLKLSAVGNQDGTGNSDKVKATGGASRRARSKRGKENKDASMKNGGRAGGSLRSLMAA